MTVDGHKKLGVFSLSDQLVNCETQFDVLRLLREVTKEFGYQYFFVAGSPSAEVKTFSEAIVITSAPSEMVQKQDASQPPPSNPLTGVLRQFSAPFEFRLDQPDQTVPANFKDFAERVAATYSLECSFVVPVYHPDHGPAAILFIGKRAPLSFMEAAELAHYGQLLHEKLRHVSARPPKPDSPLTERERECLVWTSVGKTSIEIAQILNLSEHTVNHYLNNAARKFNAVNRTQAVAHGLRFGFID